MANLTEEERAVRETAREVEKLDSDEIPMSMDDLKGQTFIGRVADVKVTSEYVLNENGQPLKEQGKHPFVTCLLEVDFMEEGHYTWKWRVSNSKKGTHAKILAAIGNVQIFSADGGDTGKRGIQNLTSIDQLVDQTFQFEKQDLQFGTDRDGNQIVKPNFPMPIEYFLPPEEEAEESDGEEESDDETKKEES